MHPTTAAEETEAAYANAAEAQFVEQVLAAVRPQLIALYRGVASGDGTLGEVEQRSRRFGIAAARTCIEQSWEQAVAAGGTKEGVACACGGIARYHSLRTAQVRSSVGVLHLRRPYYYCAGCRRGQAPLDTARGLCAGGVTVELHRLLALFGAQQSFEQAAATAAQALCVDVSATTCRIATEELGAALAEHEAAVVAAAFDPARLTLPAGPAAAPDTLYVSADGVYIAQQHADGRTEMKVGAVYTTRSVESQRHPGTREVKTDQVSYVADHAGPTDFGRMLYVEAVRRGLLLATLVVFIADGAHSLWELASEHFPNAIQILDWYHAMTYIWAVANALHGENTPQAKTWAKRQGSRLWDGKVRGVIRTCRAIKDERPAVRKAVDELVSYYTYHTKRMDYPQYRELGLQIGSGTIESGCKRVVVQRERQAGMAWSVPGATAVAKAHAWLLSGRWEAAATHQPVPKRAYQRMAA